MPQVTIEHYDFEKYVDIPRWNSYYYQITEILKNNCKNILIIGKGDGIVPNLLSSLGNEIHITTFDFDQNLKPDIVGDIRDIDILLPSCIYDCIMCCQVLEHLEHQWFKPILAKFQKILIPQGIIIVSLPQHMLRLKLEFRFGRMKLKKLWLFQKFWEGKYIFNGEHYWEVGAKGFSKKDILAIYDEYFDVIREYSVFQNTYHWFAILRKR